MENLGGCGCSDPAVRRTTDCGSPLTTSPTPLWQMWQDWALLEDVQEQEKAVCNNHGTGSLWHCRCRHREGPKSAMYLGGCQLHTYEGRKPARIKLVPETGAQLCVTRPELLATLGIRMASLKRGGSLRDVANVSLNPMGSFTCHMQYGDRSTTHEVFVIKTATRCYISLQACRDLGLVHADFPHQSQVDAPHFHTVRHGV